MTKEKTQLRVIKSKSNFRYRKLFLTLKYIETEIGVQMSSGIFWDVFINTIWEQGGSTMYLLTNIVMGEGKGKGKFTIYFNFRKLLWFLFMLLNIFILPGFFYTRCFYE